MNDFRLVPSVEFKNQYENAKHDLLKAIDSVNKLPENQRRQLVAELFGAEAVAMVFQIQIMRNRM